MSGRPRLSRTDGGIPVILFLGSLFNPLWTSDLPASMNSLYEQCARADKDPWVKYPPRKETFHRQEGRMRQRNTR